MDAQFAQIYGTDGTAKLDVLYLIHDLHDPSTRRRVMMLQAGGARVALAGFSRQPNAFARVDGVTPIDLGRTHDGRFAHRLASVAHVAWDLSARLRGIPRPHVILARNLEMLALAVRARAMLGGDIPIVYECLDIHRLMLRRDVVGGAFRSVERRLARNADLILTSSPAFRERYFERFGQFRGPIELLENKVIDFDDGAEAAPPSAPPRAEGESWRIGWFGALRCRRSLEILSDFSRQMEGRFRIVLRGRPARDQFDDFDRLVAAEPFITFQGAYRNPEDLADIYGSVHFSWLVDFFEEGLNSSWLLPNRLYEGCRYSTVPIAIAGTETARFLDKLGMGIVLSGDPSAALHKQFADMDADRYSEAIAAVARPQRSTWIVDRSGCTELVRRLAELGTSATTRIHSGQPSSTGRQKAPAASHPL